MTDAALSVPFASIEGRHLIALVDDFIALLDAPRDTADEALERLAPDAYPDDPAAAEEYRRGTRDDLVDQRISDARTVRTALERFETDAGADIVDVPRAELDGWLRTLSAMRLVLASRLGIDRDDGHDPDDPRYGTYDWLGYRLELLVQLADRLDEE